LVVCITVMVKIEEEIKQRSFQSATQKAAVNIIYTYFWIKERISKVLKPYGITMQQYNVLRILKGQYPKGITTSDIRSRMLDKMSDASRLVDRLANNGYVEKQPNKQDRRLVSVRITNEGLDLLARIKMDHGPMDEMLSHLNQQETEQLNDLLDKLRS
jgi:DNA-binding MarR family transcriptional regulator